MKKLLLLVLAIVTLTGCSLEPAYDYGEGTDIFDNTPVFFNAVPENIAYRLCEVIGESEKEFYDEFTFISYDEELKIITVETVYSGQVMEIDYRYDETVDDFYVMIGGTNRGNKFNPMEDIMGAVNQKNGG